MLDFCQHLAYGAAMDKTVTEETVLPAGIRDQLVGIVGDKYALTDAGELAPFLHERRDALLR